MQWSNLAGKSTLVIKTSTNPPSLHLSKQLSAKVASSWSCYFGKILVQSMNCTQEIE